MIAAAQECDAAAARARDAHARAARECAVAAEGDFDADRDRDAREDENDNHDFDFDHGHNDLHHSALAHEAASVVNLHAQAISVQNIRSLIHIVLDLNTGNYTRWCD